MLHQYKKLWKGQWQHLLLILKVWCADNMSVLLLLLKYQIWRLLPPQNKEFHTFASSTADGMLGKRETEKTPCREHSFILWGKKHNVCTMWAELLENKCNSYNIQIHSNNIWRYRLFLMSWIFSLSPSTSPCFCCCGCSYLCWCSCLPPAEVQKLLKLL